MDVKGHEEESIKVFGKPWTEVHVLLDQFYDSFGKKHRHRLHHENGIALVKQMYGDEAAEVARLHILSDFRLDGWKDGDPFPQSEADFIKIQEAKLQQEIEQLKEELDQSNCDVTEARSLVKHLLRKIIACKAKVDVDTYQRSYAWLGNGSWRM
jgi:hypothetical protein